MSETKLIDRICKSKLKSLEYTREAEDISAEIDRLLCCNRKCIKIARAYIERGERDLDILQNHAETIELLKRAIL